LSDLAGYLDERRSDAIQLAGRHVVVTGASRGIGAEIARELARNGARVSLVARNMAALERLKVELASPGEHAAFEADVTNAQAVDDLIARVGERMGPPFGLVNNVGGGEAVAFLDADEVHWRRMIDVNLMSAVFCTRGVLPAMIARNEGCIVNVASTASVRGYRHVSAYVAGKHALLGLTRALALEVARDGITVNAVCPGYTETEMLGDSGRRAAARTGKSEKDIRTHFENSNSGGRLMTTREVARAVTWFFGPDGRLHNGRHVVIDGGPLELLA